MTRIQTVFVSIFMAALVCVLLTSCGDLIINGSGYTYTNAGNSFSITLPAKKEGSWTNEIQSFGSHNSSEDGAQAADPVESELTDDTIDLIYSGGSAAVMIQCLSKAQAELVADTLESYEEYAVSSVLADFLDGVTYTQIDTEAPDFAVNSSAYSFSTDEADGQVIYLESSMCYYTCLITATPKVWAMNSSALTKAISTMQEL